MRFEVPFDPAVYTAKNSLRFKLVYGKILKRAWFLLGASAFFWLFVVWKGWKEDANDHDLDGLSFGFAIAFTYLAGLNFWAHYKVRGRWRRSEAATAKMSSEAGSTIIYEFEEEYFRIKGRLYDYRFQWQMFTQYVIIERTMLLYFQESSGDFLMIAEPELGYEGSKAVVSLVGTKVRRPGMTGTPRPTKTV